MAKKIEDNQVNYKVLPISPDASKYGSSAQKTILSRLSLPAMDGDEITFIGRVNKAGMDPSTRHYFDHSLGAQDLIINGDQRYWTRRNPDAQDREGPAMLFTSVARANSTPGQGRYLNGRVRRYEAAFEADVLAIRSGGHCPMSDFFQLRVTNSVTGETRRVQVFVTSSKAITKIASLEAEAASPVTE